MDAAGELAQLVEALPHLVDRRVDERRRGRSVLEAGAAQAQVERERDEPRLRAVVEVALEPAALGVAGLDDPRARRAQLDDVGAQLGVEALVLEQERGRRAGRAHRLGVLGQRAVVDDRGDVTAVALDLRDLWLAPRPPSGAGGVDVALLLGQPEREVERGVAERVRERVAQVGPLGEVGEPGDEAAHAARLRDVGAHEAGQEGERRGGEGHERQP